MPKVWRYCPYDTALVNQLSSNLRVTPLTAQVLIARGYRTPPDAQTFLGATLHDLHDPSLLPGIDDAAERVVSALKSGRRITIYGDYDVDGVTATSILWHCLKMADGKVDYYIPSRLEEGYGLNSDAVRQLAEEDSQRLLITVDCGIASVAEAAVAKELGLELIVTDHHNMARELPAAACLVHPRLPGSKYPFPDLCGAGVAFKLAWAVCQKLGGGRASAEMRNYLVSAVGLAAIGTVADVVPLVGENRVLVRYGLGSLAKRSSIGMQELLKASKLDPQQLLAADDIAFTVAPRINAAGRLGQARLAVELLTTESRDRAAQLAAYLDDLNKKRQTVERRIFKQANEQMQEHPAWDERGGLVLADADWHPGVIGIVASRVAERYEKPAILLNIKPDENLAAGSGRSFAGFDLYAGLSQCAECLTSFGGHSAAVGVKLPADRLEEFREAFGRHVGEHHEVTDRDRELQVDAEVRLADVTLRAVNELDRIGPFGQANPRPTFAATHVELASPPRTMGEGDRHLQLQIRQHNTTLRAVAFGRGEWAAEIAEHSGPIAVGFTADINRYRGRENVELKLKDWQPATNGAPTA